MGREAAVLACVCCIAAFSAPGVMASVHQWSRGPALLPLQAGASARFAVEVAPYQGAHEDTNEDTFKVRRRARAASRTQPLRQR